MFSLFKLRGGGLLGKVSRKKFWGKKKLLHTFQQKTLQKNFFGHNFVKISCLSIFFIGTFSPRVEKKQAFRDEILKLGECTFKTFANSETILETKQTRLKAFNFVSLKNNG